MSRTVDCRLSTVDSRRPSPFTFATTAFAAGKYTKKESEIAASQTTLTKPVQAKKDTKDRPTVTADDVFGGVGDKVKSVTDSQIKVLQRLIDITADNDPEKPELLFRMAELYAEQQRYYNFRAREIDQKIFDAVAAQKKDVENKMKADQASYQKLENQWLLGAVKRYLEVADHPDKYASYKKMDEVLFYLAYLLTQVKKEEAARKLLQAADQGLPEVEVLAGRVPLLRRVLLREQGAGERAQVLRQGHAVPRLAACTATRATRRAGSTTTWATSSSRSPPSSTSSSSRRSPVRRAARTSSRSRRRPRRTWSAPTRASARPTRPGPSSRTSAATTP